MPREQENSLDIKVPIGGEKYKELFWSLRDSVDSVIQSRPAEKFSPIYCTPTILNGVFFLLNHQTDDLNESRQVVFEDLADDFGYEIAFEIFRYVDAYNEACDAVNVMWDTGMHREVARFMSGGKEPYTMDDLSELIDDLRMPLESADDEEGHVLDEDVWNF